MMRSKVSKSFLQQVWKKFVRLMLQVPDVSRTVFISSVSDSGGSSRSDLGAHTVTAHANQFIEAADGKQTCCQGGYHAKTERIHPSELWWMRQGAELSFGLLVLVSMHHFNKKTVLFFFFFLHTIRFPESLMWVKQQGMDDGSVCPPIKIIEISLGMGVLGVIDLVDGEYVEYNMTSVAWQ